MNSAPAACTGDVRPLDGQTDEGEDCLLSMIQAIATARLGLLRLGGRGGIEKALARVQRKVAARHSTSFSRKSQIVLLTEGPSVH